MKFLVLAFFLLAGPTPIIVDSPVPPPPPPICVRVCSLHGVCKDVCGPQ